MESQQQRWRRHFTKPLHIQSKFDAEEQGKVRQRLSRPEMVDLLSEEEVMRAIQKLKNRKQRW